MEEKILDKNKILELISKQLNKPIEEITEDKEFVKDLGADSLDIVEMFMSLEDEYNITVSDDEAVKIKTIGDVIKLIESQK